MVLRAGALYFALVFGVGFALGLLRVLWAVPRLGERTAELMEAPIMLVAIGLAARRVVRRLAVTPTPATGLGIGLVALGLLLVAEFTAELGIRGVQYFAGRDPVAGTVYMAMLGAFALMPLLVARR